MTVETEKTLLAIQQSLLGEVSARLRALTIRMTGDYLHFDAYYDGPIDQDEVESMSCVETELIAALPDTITISHSVHRIDSPSIVPKTDIFVYMRRE